MIRCKFRVVSITQYENSNASIKLNVVHGGSEENKAFFASTPGGEITVSIVKPEVAAVLQLGKAFYVDFTEAT